MKTTVQDILLAKSGKAVIALAGDFLNMEIGQKILTISELQEKHSFSRGTIQNALVALKDLGAIDIESKKHCGSYLINKDIQLLLKIMGIESLVGCMPLPYSKRYEGLATGLVSTIEDSFGISSSLAFVRGAKNRINMLLSGRYDYAIVSLMAARQLINDGKNITIVKNFGRGSYTGDHVIIFHDKKDHEITDGMRVGVDPSSIDQMNLTEMVCKGIKVKMVNVSYSNVLKMVLLGEIDCAVWNKDEIFDKYIDVNYVNIDKAHDDTVAVLVADSSKEQLITLLNKAVEISVINEKQQQVIAGMLTPNY